MICSCHVAVWKENCFGLVLISSSFLILDAEMIKRKEEKDLEYYRPFTNCNCVEFFTRAILTCPPSKCLFMFLLLIRGSKNLNAVLLLSHPNFFPNCLGFKHRKGLIVLAFTQFCEYVLSPWAPYHVQFNYWCIL